MLSVGQTARSILPRRKGESMIFAFACADLSEVAPPGDCLKVEVVRLSPGLFQASFLRGNVGGEVSGVSVQLSRSNIMALEGLLALAREADSESIGGAINGTNALPFRWNN